MTMSDEQEQNTCRVCLRKIDAPFTIHFPCFKEAL